MSVKIRMKRTGRHKVATYRIVVADSRSPRDGRFIEEIGIYHPTESNSVVLNKESALEWLKKGAQPSDTVRNILSDAGVIKAYHDFKLSEKKVKPAKEKPAAKPVEKKEPAKKAPAKKPAAKKPAVKKTEAAVEAKAE